MQSERRKAKDERRLAKMGTVECCSVRYVRYVCMYRDVYRYLIHVLFLLWPITFTKIYAKTHFNCFKYSTERLKEEVTYSTLRLNPETLFLISMKTNSCILS